MTGSLRYALEPADDLRVAEVVGRRNAFVAAVGRCCADLAGRPPRTLPLWAAGAAQGSAAAAPDATPSVATGSPPGAASGSLPATAGRIPLTGAWLEPFPDDLCPEQPGPPARFAMREAVDLTFVAALQLVPLRERGLIVLHDVLGFDGGQAAGRPGPELAAARAAFAAARAAVPAPPRASLPEDEPLLMMRFLFACESADGDGLRALLSPDALLQCVPEGGVHAGPDAVARRLLAGDDGRHPAAGLQRLLPRRANGRLAFGAYRRAARDGPFRAHAIWVVTLDGSAVAGIVSFAMPALFPDFDLLPTTAAQGERPSA
jgi:RNA polymerase sigma-70 factor (ECF subfamily)